MHAAEWYADDSDAEQQAKDGVRDCNFPPPEENPQHIEQDHEASAPVSAYLHLLPEWSKGKHSHAPKCDAKRNAYDGDAGQQAVYEIPKRRKQASKYQPENIP